MPCPIPKNHKETGRRGEKLASMWLVEQGYKVLETNLFFSKKGELDIVALSPDSDYVFIEVKSQWSQNAGKPIEWVTFKKQKQIVKLTHLYCAKNNLLEESIRYDVITVDFTRDPIAIEHYPQAFIPNIK